MNDLLAQVIAAHGGIGRWDTFKRVTATVVTGGGLWPMKGLEQDPNSREETVTLHEEIASVSPLFLLSANRTGTQLSRLIVSRSKPPRGPLSASASIPEPLSLAT
jgi:hypothetical protein